MKNSVVSFCLLLVLACNNVCAQNEQFEWIFGSSGAGLRFDPNTLIPTVTSGNFTPFTREGCSVVSNPVTGAMMFYTDGLSVIDAFHNRMPNGSGLNGNESSAQGALVTVRPGSCNQFYIFHNNRVAHEFTGGDLSYSVVDLSLPGNGTLANPLGDVVGSEKNKLIDTNAAEGMMIVPDKNGSRFWLISPAQNGSLIRVYRIDEQGVELQHTFNSGISMAMVRSVRFSEQSGKVVIVSSIENDPVFLLDFDSDTGLLSNPFVVPGTRLVPGSSYFAGFYDSEWSGDGTKLYLSRFYVVPTGTGKLYQYDLDTPTDPMIEIYSLPGNNLNHSSGLKRGPDGKIYHQYINLTYGDKRIIGVINAPNVKGSGCNYNPTAINLGINIPLSHKFPEFLNFTDLDFLNNGNVLNKPFGQDTILCQGEELLLDAKNTGSNYFWSDGSTGQSLMVDQQGEYRVTIQNGCSLLRDTINIQIMEPPVFDLGKDMVLCTGETLTLKIEDVVNSTILWNDGSSDPFLHISQPGTYRVEVGNRCGSMKDTINVLYKESPVIDLGKDTLLCSGETMTLNAEVEAGSTILWNDGSSDPTLLVTQTGTYSVEIRDLCGTAKDTINVLVMIPPTIDLGDDQVLCAGEVLNLKIETTGGIISWGNGSDGNELSITNSGEYVVTITNQCGTAWDSIEVEFLSTDPGVIPNVITPNGDLLNDYFIIGDNLRGSKLRIVNRWGGVVFFADAYQNDWNAEHVSAGTYYYTIITPCQVFLNGYIQVIK